MLTKQIGDIAEYKVVAELLERGFSVLLPIGDRLPYDLVVEYNGTFIRIQVKNAYLVKEKYYAVNTQRSQTNRKVYKLTPYSPKDFDFCIVWNRYEKAFYVIPSTIFCSYKGHITVGLGGQRKKAINSYLDRWDLLRGESVFQQVS